MANISLKLLIKISLLFCLTLFMACDSDSETPQKETPQKEIPIEAELQWQLGAIIENGEKLATPGNYMSAYLIFEDDLIRPHLRMFQRKPKIFPQKVLPTIQSLRFALFLVPYLLCCLNYIWHLLIVCVMLYNPST